MIALQVMQPILKMKLCFSMQKAQVKKKKNQEKYSKEEKNVYPRKHVTSFLYPYFRPSDANNSWLLET